MEVLQYLLDFAPSFAGLIALAWFLMRQNSQLLEVVLRRLDDLSERIQNIEIELSSKDK